MADLFDEFGIGGAQGGGSDLLDEFGIEPPKASGIVDTLKEGAKATGRAVGAAVNTYTGNGQGIADKALTQQQAPRDERLEKFHTDYAERTAALGDDPGVLETIGQGIGAIADNPAGAGLAVVEQLPNAAVALGGGWAGMKAGAAAGGALGTAVGGIGAVPGAAAGSILGGIAGMFLGNTALETGHKAMGLADDGEVTPEEMSQAKREGAIKGGVITGVDVLTLGIGGKVASVMQRPTAAAMEAATRKVLIDQGVDVANEAAVLAATKNPAIATAVRTAQDNARKATDKLGKRAAVAGTLLTMETAGEGLGEYLGELAATGEGSVPDAVLESLLSLGQSGAETAWNIARTAPSRMIQPQPSAENPAPAPVPAPDPQAGAISRTAAMLPGPSIAGMLPDPGQTLYGDASGNLSPESPDGQTRNFDREYRPTGRERGPRDFGPGMDRQAGGNQPADGYDYANHDENTLEGEIVTAREVFRAQRPLGIPDMRADSGAINVSPDGTAVPGKIANTPPKNYVPQGGPGMDQQREVGKTYKGLPAANRAIRSAANPEQLEAVKVGPQTFEVRAKPKPAKRIVNRDRDSVMQAVIRLGGVKTEWRRDTTGDDKGNKFLPGVGALWSDKTGTGLDDMASLLDQSGYVPAGEMQRDGGVSWLQQALRDEAGGMKTRAAPGSKLQEEQAIKAEADRLEAQAAQEEAASEFDAAETVASDLLDDIDLLEIRRSTHEAFVAELDAIFGDSPSESSPRTQAADQTADRIQGQSKDAGGSTGEGEPGAVRGADTRTESKSEVAPALELRSQTEEQLAEADAANKARIKAEEKAQAEADEKQRKADGAAFVKQQNEAANADFQLGQNAEDNLTGQGSIFDAPQAVAAPPATKDNPPETGAQRFITAPDGSTDFGEITSDMAKAAGRQAGKIRLQQGDDSWGLQHIEQRHGTEIRDAGFADVPAFVADIAQHIDQVWKPAATRQLVALHKVGNNRMMFVELQPGKDEAGDFYTVNTAFTSRKAEKKGWKLLWEARAQASGESGNRPSFAVSPPVAGGEVTNPSSQSSETSIAPPADDKPGSKVKSEPAAKVEDVGNIPLFSRSSQPGSEAGSLSSEQLERLYQHLTQNLKNAPPLSVVRLPVELPFEAPADARGVHHRGTIYLVADNITSAQDARDVIAHEMIGHFGLTGFFGRELDAVLGVIHGANPRVRMLAAKWRRENADLIADWEAEYGMTDAQVQARSTEEALATMAERGDALNGWRRLAAVLQTLLRNMGAKSWANALEAKTNAEALLALKKADMFVRRGMVRGNPWADISYAMFRRAYHGSPHKGIEKEGFKLNAIGTGEGAQAYGWGIYFAGAREVAEHYRQALGEMTFKGKPLPTKEYKAGNGVSPKNLAIMEVARVLVKGRAHNGLAGAAIPGTSFEDAKKEVLTSMESGVSYARSVSRDKSFQQLAQDYLAAMSEMDKFRESDFQAGQTYQSEIPEDSELLDWGKPLSKQPKVVRAALRRALADEAVAQEIADYQRNMRHDPFSSEVVGSEAYGALADFAGGEREASELLGRYGIPGLRYLDGGSRAAGEGSHNYVIWDESRLTPEAAQIQPLFSRGSAGSGIGRGDVPGTTGTVTEHDAIKLIAERIGVQLGLGVPIQSYRSEAALFAAEPAISNQAEKDGAKGQVNAVFYRGKVHVVTSAFARAADVEMAILDALAHEGQGHHGIRAMYGNDAKAVDAALREVFAAIGGVAGVKRLAAKNSLDLSLYLKTAEGMSERQRAGFLADELLAHLQGRAATAGLSQRALAAIKAYLGAVREWLRGHGFPNLAKGTDADIALLLKRMREAAQRKPTGKGLAARFAVASSQVRFRRAAGVTTDAFKRWFGASKVVDKQGEPKILYHGTGEDFTVFDQGRSGSSARHNTAPLGIFMTGDRDTAQAYADKASDGIPGYARVMQLYAAIRNPYMMSVAESLAIASPGEAAALRGKLEREGYDGINLKGTDTWVAFSNTQVKSATDNNGEFDEWSGDIRFKRTADFADALKGMATGKGTGRTADAFTDLDQGARDFLNKVGTQPVMKRASDWVRERTERAATKIRQGIVDRYAALKELDEKLLGKDFIDNAIHNSSWVLARMSSAASGAMNAMLTTGRLRYDAKERVIALRDGDESGGLSAVLSQLGPAAEVERFMGWIAANRASKLMAEGRENLFTADEIASGRQLNAGRTEDGRARPLLYAKVFTEFQQYRDDVLSIAEATGVISAESRAMWRDEFYVPFYRVMNEDAMAGGPQAGKGLSRQEAYKKLKGGRQNLNDLLENTLMNFHHLLSASLKNQAAAQTMTNAEKIGVARVVPESRRDPKTSTFVLEKGERVFYEIDDPMVFEALTALADPGLNNLAVETMAAFKRLFTNMTTITPQFIVANTIRDLMQAMATSPTSKNLFKNTAQGLAGYRDAKTRAQMQASGGAFSFGHLYGADVNEVKASLNRTVKGAQLITDPSMVPKILRAGWRKWGDIADTAENISRAATYLQNVDEKGLLRASYEARDIMDFSQHGAWPAVRFLIRVVPFLNARLQGLDKLYRSGVKPSLLTAMGKGTEGDKEAAGRFSVVTGALVVASVALYLANADDDEYRKLEDWQKDSYWFFRIGDSAFFLPKPFEVGAIATMAERLTEQMVDDKATGKLFADRLKDMLTQTFSFSPVPQMFQPVLDIYSNKDAFTGRDIESMGMDRLSKGLRSRENTTAAATALSAVSRSLGDDSPVALSPVQADHLIRGYFGSVGATAAGLIDTIWRGATGQESPDKNWSEYQPIRRFYRDLGAPAPYTRYSTLFYDGLREASRVYADVRELQSLGKTEEAQELSADKRGILAMRLRLNQQQRRMSEINKQMEAVKRSDNDGAWKRRELDRLTLMRNRISEQAGMQIESMRAQE